MATEREHEIKLKVQEVLDELFLDNLISFELTAYAVKGNGHGEYLVRFHDSRLHSIVFSSKDKSTFKETVRAAILEGLNRSGSLGEP